jgi:acetate kinase
MELVQPVLLDPITIERLREKVSLDRRHNQPSLEVIEKAREDLSHDVPMVAVFDTAFHQTLPSHARRYALPEPLVQKHGLWRYGFHGLAHRWMMERYGFVAEHPVVHGKLITIQLGSGCSISAIDNGKSIDTSMGLTPLEGLMMSTRCGDVDPMLPYLLASGEGIDRDELEECLYGKSGLLGVSGASGDVHALLDAEQKLDLRAKLALEMYCYRVRKYIGAYLAVLGGADAIIFGGGVGENEPAIRSKICRNMGWCGLRIAEQRNKQLVNADGCISESGSSLPAYVITVNEETLIARDTFQCLAVQGAVPAKG